FHSENVLVSISVLSSCLSLGVLFNLMSAPNLLRVGTAENIFVECQDCSDGKQVINIFVKNYPTKAIILANTQVTLTNETNFQGFGQVTIPPGIFKKDPTAKQYVFLEAEFPGRILQNVVMVSFQSGYIFIQTDKTLYTPNSKGRKVNNDKTDTSIDIEIVVFWQFSFLVGFNLFDTVCLYSPGLWKIVAKFQSNPQESFSTNFEVKEYVLPSFEVKLSSSTHFFYVDGETLEIEIKARYLFGQDVNGNAYVVFGVMEQGQKKSLPASLSRVPIENGEGKVVLKREQITETFQDINQLVGNSIFVSVIQILEKPPAQG
uniref:Uncharacterized protein n=1 Tax=Oryzias sinensis TaxID=183150 RepID=A0A8C7WLV0_9TELE